MPPTMDPIGALVGVVLWVLLQPTAAALVGGFVAGVAVGAGSARQRLTIGLLVIGALYGGLAAMFVVLVQRVFGPGGAA